MEKTIKTGVMPGRINEFVVSTTATFAEVLALAELTTDGYEVKADGVRVTDFNQPVGSTNLLLLAKQIKGNAEKTVKTGIMPGRISEFVVDTTTTFAQLLEIAGLNPEGYEVKADGTRVTDFNQQVGSTNLLLLAKQVKGNKNR